MRKITALFLIVLLMCVCCCPVQAEQPCMLLVKRVYTDPATGAVLLEACSGNVDSTNNAGAVFSGFDLNALATYTVADTAVIWLPENISAPGAQKCVSARELPDWYTAAGTYLTAMGVQQAFFAAVTLQDAATVSMLTLCTFN